MWLRTSKAKFNRIINIFRFLINIITSKLFGNEPIDTALLWPPVLLLLTTGLLASGTASLASRAQRALYTYQGSRPIVTTCAANHGPSLAVFSLGGSAMLSPLSPSCRLAERPLNTYRFVGRPSFLQVTTLHRHNSTHTTLYNSIRHNSTPPQFNTQQLDTLQFDTKHFDTLQLGTSQLDTA